MWISVSLFFFGVVVNAAVAVHYYTLYVQIGDSTTLSRLQLCFYVGSLIGVVFWTIVGRRFDKRPLCIISLMGTASLMVLATVLFGDGHIMGTGEAFPLLAGNVLAGLFAGALWVLPGSMLADVADQDELTSGERREGLFFGLLNFGEKIAAGAALLFAGILLDVFVHLETGGTQDPTSVAARRPAVRASAGGGAAGCSDSDGEISPRPARHRGHSASAARRTGASRGAGTAAYSRHHSGRSEQSMADMNQHGETVVITGAGSGMGLECALHLAASGYRVQACVLTDAEGESVKAAAASRNVSLRTLADGRHQARRGGSGDSIGACRFRRRSMPSCISPA